MKESVRGDIEVISIDLWD